MKLIKTVMRFKVLVLLALLFPVGTIAQENKGIRFDKSMSWEEVVKKATRENKYIFMDVMATLWHKPFSRTRKSGTFLTSILFA